MTTLKAVCERQQEEEQMNECRKEKNPLASTIITTVIKTNLSDDGLAAPPLHAVLVISDLVEVSGLVLAILVSTLDKGTSASLTLHQVTDLGGLGQACSDDVTRGDLNATDLDLLSLVEADHVESPEDVDEGITKTELEGDLLGLGDPTRDKEDLLVLDVDDLNGANAAGEVKDLRLAEGLSSVPTLALLEDDRGVQALLNAGPDGEVGGELVALNAHVAAIPNANLLDGLETHVVCGVASKDVRHTGLNTKTDDGKDALLLPLGVPLELVVTELLVGLGVGVLRVGLAEGHRHVNVVAASVERSVEDLLVEVGLARIDDDGDVVLLGEGLDLLLVVGIDLLGREALLTVGELGLDLLGAGKVVV
jgi:hypothetical protein